MKQFKVQNAIACEYVSQGAGGRHTLLNVYTGDTLVHQVPALIPIAFYIELMPDKSHPPLIKVAVLKNNDKMAEIEAKFEFVEGHVGVLVIPQMGWPISADTEVKVVASGRGMRSTVLKEMKIRVAIDPNASQPPSEQSPPDAPASS